MTHMQLLKLALEMINAQKEWIDAVPHDTPLPVMPGYDGDWFAESYSDIKIQVDKDDQQLQP